jgi:hypothetical protein
MTVSTTSSRRDGSADGVTTSRPAFRAAMDVSGVI